MKIFLIVLSIVLFILFILRYSKISKSKKLGITGITLLAIIVTFIYTFSHSFDGSVRIPSQPDNNKNIETDNSNHTSGKLSGERTEITTDSLTQKVVTAEKLVTKATADAEKIEVAELNERKVQLTNEGFKHFELYHLNEYLSADFNGDNVKDFAAFIRKNGDTSIITITDGKTHQIIHIGNGARYGNMQDNFAWASYWGIVQPQETFEEIVKGDEIIDEKKTKLLYPSILIKHAEGNGGIITYRNGKYDWVHQAD